MRYNMVILSYDDEGGCACKYKVAFEGKKPRVQDEDWGMSSKVIGCYKNDKSIKSPSSFWLLFIKLPSTSHRKLLSLCSSN
jgi:hypothetical protein